MNILYVSQSPIVDMPDCGSQQRTKLLWDAICTVNHSGGNYLLSVEQDNDRQDDEFVHYFKLNGKGYRTFSGLFSKFIKTLAGIGLLPSFLVNEFNPKKWFPNVKFDYIICRYLRSACLFPFYKQAPIIVDYDDHPIQSFDTVIKYLMPIGIRPFAKIFNRVQFYLVNKRIAGGFMSDNIMAAKYGNIVICLPNAVNEPSKSYCASYENRSFLFTVGIMGYSPNAEGVERFLNTVWPKFHAKYPTIKYYIAGKDAPSDYIKKWNSTSGVNYLGFTEDLDSMYEHCIAAIIPIWQGSGTAIKTREAMMHSRCCLSTAFGARGLENATEIMNKGLFIFDDAEDFISAFEIIECESNRNEYENYVYNYGKSHFSTSVFVEKLQEMILMVTARNVSSREFLNQ